MSASCQISSLMYTPHPLHDAIIKSTSTDQAESQNIVVRLLIESILNQAKLSPNFPTTSVRMDLFTRT